MNLFDFELKDIFGKEIDWKQFEGKKFLLVNTASECGYTPQYAQLEELQTQFREKLQVIAFPCNDFGGQEPGTPEEIQHFCTTKFHIHFPLAEKITIRGEEVHPIFHWLQTETQTQISWNFHKFTIEKDGSIHNNYPPSTSPLDDEILNWLTND